MEDQRNFDDPKVQKELVDEFKKEQIPFTMPANEIGTVIGVNPYNPRWKFIESRVFVSPKEPTNEFKEHGNKFEKIALMIYEKEYDVKTFSAFENKEHNEHKFLTARPDALVIEDNHNKEAKFSWGANRLVEIKCPKVGNNDVMMRHYYAQIQLELAIFEKEACDLVIFDLREFKDFNEFQNSNYKYKGVGLCIFPKHLEDMADTIPELLFGRAAYIAPPSLDMKRREAKQWAEDFQI